MRFDEDSTRLPQSRKPIRASKYLRSQSDRISLISPFLKQSPAAEVVSRQTARFATGGAIFSSLYIDQGRRPPLFEWLIFPVRDLEQSTIHVR